MSMFKKREKKSQKLEILQDENELENEEEDESYLTNKRFREEIENKKQRKQNFSTKEQNQLDKKFTEEIISDLNFKSSYALKNINDATLVTEEHAEDDQHGRALYEKQLKLSKDILEGKVDDKTYKGKKGYIVYAEKSERDKEKAKFTGSLGPLKAPTNIRLTSRVDYAQGVCKDYKETGRCGFGDSCIFMHDRGDYKLGWELDLEWEAQKRKEDERKRKGGCSSEESDYEIDEDENLPKACQICGGNFNNPVETKCLHYFCESCALSHYGKSANCFVCKKPTHGIFNNAEFIFKKLEKLEKKQLRKKKEKQKRSSHIHNNCSHEDEEVGGVENLYADNLTQITKEFLDDDDEEEAEFPKNKKGKKKNVFKAQNGWLPPSDYRSYQ